MWSKFLEFKPLVIKTVFWAENAMLNHSGKEKMEAVVKKLLDVFISAIPFPFSILKKFFAKRGIRWLVNLAVRNFNLLAGVNWRHETLTQEKLDSYCDAMEVPIEEIIEVSSDVNSVDERLEELKNRYLLSPNLSRHEVRCRCGCGFDEVTQELINTFQTIRDHLGKPIMINSGCRCRKHNGRVGGVAQSAHMTGEALDIRVNGMTARSLGDFIKRLYENGYLPYLQYCYLMANPVHIATDERTRRGTFGW